MKLHKILELILLVLIGFSVLGSPFPLPDFVTDVPPGHFAGISSPLETISDARSSAVSDVIRQILGNINASYDHRLVDRISGSPRNPSRDIEDRLYGSSSGIVLGVEQNIVKSSCIQVSGRYICFILVRYPEALIAEMRRLSRGAKVIASIESIDGNSAVIRVSEANGVAVVLTSADVIAHRRNRYAKAISFFVVHVPESSSREYSVPVNPVRVCDGSVTVRLPIGTGGMDLSDLLVGADVSYSIILYGHDEISRAVTVEVGF